MQLVRQKPLQSVLLFFVTGLLLVLTGCDINPGVVSNNLADANHHKSGGPQSLNIKQFVLPENEFAHTNTQIPGGLIAGPGNTVWFTEAAEPGGIGRMTSNGKITIFPIPGIDEEPRDITWGPDGALWFTVFVGNEIGRMDTHGKVQLFPLKKQFSDPWGIVSGPDGAVWFTEFGGNKIGRIDRKGHISEWTIPSTDTRPEDIIVGSNRTLWFTESLGNRIGRMTMNGHFSEFPLRSPSSSINLDAPEFLTHGPDGNLWFTAYEGIGRITPNGTITAFHLQPPPPPFVFNFSGITLGPDGALWFTEYSNNTIGRIDRYGHVTTYPVAPTNGSPERITSGSDRTVWFNMNSSNYPHLAAIGVFRL